MTKAEELKAQGCLNKAADDEPIFVLRAQDRFAPGIVREWARRAGDEGTSNEKVDAAYDLASQMEEWAKANGSKTPD